MTPSATAALSERFPQEVVVAAFHRCGWDLGRISFSDVCAGIGVARFHLHFLQQDKQDGGHPLEYRRRAGKVQICTVHDLRVELPTSAEFLKTNFDDRALARLLLEAKIEWIGEHVRDTKLRR